MQVEVVVVVRTFVMMFLTDHVLLFPLVAVTLARPPMVVSCEAFRCPANFAGIHDDLPSQVLRFASP
jgi:hypothetical protein